MIKHTPVKNQFIEPNTTQTPNCFFDFYLKILSDAELRVTGAVIRHTYGWHEKDYRFALSLTDLEEATGLARTNIARACKRLIVSGTTKLGTGRPAILGRKKVKGGKYLYWLLIHTAKSMGQGVHAASTGENDENMPQSLHAASTEVYMQHVHQLYMQHVQPKDKRNHVNKHVKPTVSSSSKVPTGRKAKRMRDDDLKKTIPAGTTTDESKISVPLTETPPGSDQTAAQPAFESDNIVIRRSGTSDGQHSAAIVAKWFEKLSNGGRWRKDRDQVAYEAVKHCRLEHILLGLCYSVAHARGHSFSKFGYAVPAIKSEYETSVQYGTTADDLMVMAAHHVAITVTALKSGKWLVTDYDPAELPEVNAKTRELARTVLALTAS